ncbi:hypothetical protein E8E15_001916 [Penicillium rubens]|nr:hypothetical protein E8E15_001916 [Penicillium rubens]KAJ5033072.1 hypothetical protein NUH16_003202 [Penicillium rubens]
MSTPAKVGKTLPSKKGQKLEKLYEGSQNGEVSQVKSQSANAQANFIPPAKPREDRDPAADQPVQAQSKPPYDGQEGDKAPPSSTQKEPVEPEDIPMSDSSSQHGSDTSSGHESYSTGGTDDLTEDELLADFQTLSVGGGQTGKVDGFGGKGRSRFFIFQVGPRRAPRFVFERTNGYTTEGFINLSIYKYRISQIKYEDEKGEEHWQYTRENVIGIVGVAIEEREESLREYKKAPETWIKIKWRNIKKEHEKLLSRNCSWIPKSDLIRLTDKKSTENKIGAAWDRQEERYCRYQGETQRDSRSPTPFPLDVFKKKKLEREQRDSRSPTPFPLEDKSEREHRAGSRSVTPGLHNKIPARATNSVPRTVPADGSESAGTVHIKMEEVDDPELFVPAAGNTTRLNAEGVGNMANNQVDLSHIEFSQESYLKEKGEEEKWSTLSDQDKETRRTIALANWVVYRDTMISLKAKEVRAVEEKSHDEQEEEL